MLKNRLILILALLLVVVTLPALVAQGKPAKSGNPTSAAVTGQSVKPPTPSPAPTPPPPPTPPSQPVPIQTSSSGEKVKISGDVVVEQGETVPSVVAVRGNVTVKGHVTGDATAVAGNVNITSTGRVDGDAVAVGGKVITEDGGIVGGSATSVAGWSGPWLWGFEGFRWYFPLGMALLFAAMAAVVVALFPQRLEMVSRVALEKPGLSVLYGVIAILLIFPVMMFLVLTVLGIPLVAVEFLLLFVAWITGAIAIGLAVGRKLAEAASRPQISPVLAVVVGTLILGLIKLIPFAGQLFVVVLGLIGFGAALLTGFGTHENWLPNRCRRQTPAYPPYPQYPGYPPPPPPPGPPSPPGDAGQTQ